MIASRAIDLEKMWEMCVLALSLGNNAMVNPIKPKGNELYCPTDSLDYDLKIYYLHEVFRLYI